MGGNRFDAVISRLGFGPRPATTLTRRGLLLRLVLAPAALLTARSVSASSQLQDEALASRHRLGKAYFERFPLLAMQDAQSHASTVNDALAMRQDFASGNTVILDGWVLSRTECRVCAHAYLAEMLTHAH